MKSCAAKTLVLGSAIWFGVNGWGGNGHGGGSFSVGGAFSNYPGYAAPAPVYPVYPNPYGYGYPTGQYQYYNPRPMPVMYCYPTPSNGWDYNRPEQLVPTCVVTPPHYPR